MPLIRGCASYLCPRWTFILPLFLWKRTFEPLKFLADRAGRPEMCNFHYFICNECWAYLLKSLNNARSRNNVCVNDVSPFNNAVHTRFILILNCVTNICKFPARIKVYFYKFSISSETWVSGSQIWPLYVCLLKELFDNDNWAIPRNESHQSRFISWKTHFLIWAGSAFYQIWLGRLPPQSYLVKSTSC